MRGSFGLAGGGGGGGGGGAGFCLGSFGLGSFCLGSIGLLFFCRGSVGLELGAPPGPPRAEPDEMRAAELMATAEGLASGSGSSVFQFETMPKSYVPRILVMGT